MKDIYTQRAKMVEDGNGIDWALAEQAEERLYDRVDLEGEGYHV